MSTENNPSSYTPRPANGRAKIAVLALALAALALYIVSVAISAYKGVLMMGALLVVTAAIFLAYRYLFSTYTYRIFYTEDGVGYFLVEQGQGKRLSLVAQIPLHTVVSLAAYQKSAVPQGKFFAFCATLSGGEYQILHSREGGQNTVIKLEMSEDFFALLSEKTNEARTGV